MKYIFSKSEQRKDLWYKYLSTNTNCKHSSETQTTVLLMNEEFICVKFWYSHKFKCMENVFHGNYFTNYNWWVLGPSPLQKLRKTQVSRKLKLFTCWQTKQTFKKAFPWNKHNDQQNIKLWKLETRCYQ